VDDNPVGEELLDEALLKLVLGPVDDCLLLVDEILSSSFLLASSNT